MRKDLQIGLAIGGVLLAVLIVYMMIPSKQPVPGSGTSGSSVASSSGGNSAASGSAAKSSDTSKVASLSGDAQSATAGGAASGTGVRAISPLTSTTPDRSAGNESRMAIDTDTSTRTVQQQPAATSGNSRDWASLLNTPLMTRTPSGATDAPITTEEPRGSGASSSRDSTAGTGSAAPAGSSLTRSDNSDTSTSNQSINSTQKGTLMDPFANSVSGGTAAPANGSRTHRVQTGETYVSIAKMIYGSTRYTSTIEKANPGIDPRRLKPGMNINLPDPQQVKSESAEGSAQTASSRQEAKLGANEYRVVSGDTLERISRKQFGTSTLQDEIYRLNESTIGSDRNRLKINTVLKMPEKSGRSSTDVR